MKLPITVVTRSATPHRQVESYVLHSAEKHKYVVGVTEKRFAKHADIMHELKSLIESKCVTTVEKAKEWLQSREHDPE